MELCSIQINMNLNYLVKKKKDGSIIYGALEKANQGGILLIDEVTEIPLETQSKILRVLIDQKFKRINGKT